MEPNKKNEEQNKAQQPEQDKQEQPGTAAAKAAALDSVIGSPTENVRAKRSDATWSNTGTNISYEGQTAPAGGGSVGTGESSGQSATGSSINAANEYESGRLGHTEDKDDTEDTAKKNEEA